MPNEFDVPVPPFAAHDPTPYRRSLRASRARRAAAAVRRRRTGRGRRSLTCALLTASLLAVGASADTGSPRKPAAVAKSTVAAVQSALGIPADGVMGPVTRKAVRSFQRKEGLTVDGVIGPQTLAALGIDARSAKKAVKASASKAAISQDASSLLEAIALCESGGDPTLVSKSGRYRGKYQFDRATWKSVGGKGDPAAAPEDEQDRRAERLMAERGPSAWPACSKKVGAG
ncbi:endolysin [Paraconexibacter sp. AEG42_29]|uniref:Endolysin n=1 Tax=Paraconexibacter sp. AEG42_29 TaxID=2997339 RepID=A0AAU7B305_9ACTN